MLGNFGPFDPRYHKIDIGSAYVELDATALLAHSVYTASKDIQQFMPFLSYNDACFNCPVILTSNVSGRNAHIYLRPQNAPQYKLGYVVWYLAVTDK